MGSLIKHAKKIKKACIGIATGITVATMMIPPIVLSQMIMMDQEDKEQGDCEQQQCHGPECGFHLAALHGVAHLGRDLGGQSLCR